MTEQEGGVGHVAPSGCRRGEQGGWAASKAESLANLPAALSSIIDISYHDHRLLYPALPPQILQTQNSLLPPFLRGYNLIDHYQHMSAVVLGNQSSSDGR